MKWRILLFLLVFIGIIILSNLYVWWRLTPLGTNKHWFLFLVLISLGAFLMGALDRWLHNDVTRWLYLIGMVYWGFLFFLFCSFVVTEPSRYFIEPRTITFVALGLATLLSIVSLVNGQLLAVEEVEVPVAHLEKEVRVIQMSDIHLGSIRQEAWLARAVALAKEQQPDFVVITGDLFDGSRVIAPETLAPLSNLGVPVFLSIGNHELYDGVANIEDVIARTNITLLRNEVTIVSGIQVAGIDHPAQEMRRDNPVARAMKLDKKKPAILLYHPPTGVEDAAAAGFDLQLSGHTHDGQVMPFNLLVKPFYPRINGVYHIGNTSLYTSPGTGTWGPPMRLGSRNEVTLLRLVPQSKNQ